MSSAKNNPLIAITSSLLAISGFVVSGVSLANAQQATLLRPSLDVNATRTDNNTQNSGAQTAQNIQTVTTSRTNAPQPIRLLSNQPQPLPPPPPRIRRTHEADPFAPIGVKVGSFRVFPVIGISSVFTDNARSDHSGKTKDIGLQIAPSIRIQSDWLRHSYTFSASSDHLFYAKSKEVNANTLNTTGTFRLDIRRNTNLTTSANYTLSQTSSASSEVPGTAIGDRRDHEVSFNSALTHRLNRLLATLSAGATWQMFEKVKLSGGGFENNADRAYVEPNVKFRLGYEVSPNITPFAEIGYTPRFHNKKLDRNGLRRDSQGIDAQLGFGFNLSPIWDGEIAATYEHRNFKDPTLSNINAFGLNATINWRPSELTTLSLIASTSIDESSTAGISGTRNIDIALNTTHRFRENITGTLNLGLNYDDFIGTSNDDVYYTIQTGIAYALNRKIEWTANYQFTHFNSGTSGSDFTENRLISGFRFRL